MDVEILGDRYEMQEPIGRGGMATIFRAVDLRMGRTVAVKMLRDVYSTDPKFVTRFQREARAASLLQHPNIVQVYDYGQSGEVYYIVMEFINGTDLRQYLKRHGRLSSERAVAIAHDVALGLGAAHKRGIVHRDVKPQNILLNEEELVKLTDFGIASVYKDVDAERLTTTGMTLGTVQYYAPEQAQGEIVTPAADVYALGIVLYEMLTGRTPFDGDTPVAVAMKHIQDLPDPPSRYNPSISPPLERIILRCLEKDPRDRYRDGDALAYALENFERRGSTLPPSLPAGRNSSPGGLLRNYNAGLDGPAGAGASDFRRGGPVSSGPAGLSTRPHGPAASTLSRTPIPRHNSGPNGLPFNPDDPQNTRRTGPVVAIVVSAVVLLLVTSCFLVFQLGGGLNGLFSAFASSPPTATPVVVTVPNFVNHTFVDAQALARQDNLTLTTTYQTSPSVPKDTVINQTPPEGHYTGINPTVALILSSGPSEVTVPDVTGKAESIACNTLKSSPYFFVCSEQPPIASTLPAGEVVKTSPTAGQLEPPQSIIQIWVSLGPPTPTLAPTATTGPTPTPTGSPTPTPTPTPKPTCTPGVPVPTTAPTPTPGC